MSQGPPDLVVEEKEKAEKDGSCKEDGKSRRAQHLPRVRCPCGRLPGSMCRWMLENFA